MKENTQHPLLNTGPDEKGYFIDTWQINGYTIGLVYTIVLCYRIVSFPVDTNTYWRTNWDAGEKEADAALLLNAIIQAIDEGKIDKAPWPVPPMHFYKDDKRICKFIEPFKKVYVDEIKLELVAKKLIRHPKIDL